MTLEADALLRALENEGARHVTTHAGRTVVWRTWGPRSPASRPLLLLHGGYGSWRHFARNIEPLARRRRLLVPDLPGHGDSDPPLDGWTAESLGETLGEGVAELAGAGTPLDGIGFSLGGIVLVHVARACAGRLTRLVLVGSEGMGFPPPELPRLRSLRRLGGHGDAASVAEVHRYNLAAVMFADPACADALAVEIQAANVHACRLDTDHLPLSDALARALPGLPARLFGIWGERDVFAGGAIARREARLRAADPGLDFRVVPGAGHWVPYEAAGSFNAIVQEMLSPVASPGGASAR